MVSNNRSIDCVGCGARPLTGTVLVEGRRVMASSSEAGKRKERERERTTKAVCSLSAVPL